MTGDYDPYIRNPHTLYQQWVSTDSATLTTTTTTEGDLYLTDPNHWYIIPRTEPYHPYPKPCSRRPWGRPWDAWKGAWGEIQESKEVPQEPMKILYNVIVVNRKGDILIDKKVVASDADEAKFLAEVDGAIRKNYLKPADVTVICSKIAEVKAEKEAQKVKIVKEEDA